MYNGTIAGFELLRNNGLRKVLDLEVGSYISDTQIDEWSAAAQPIMIIRFRVGAEGFAQDGDTEFFIRDCDGNLILGKKIVLYRENEIVTEEDFEFGVTYNSVNAKIKVIPELNQGERMEVWVYRNTAFVVCGDNGEFLMINNDNDFIMINSEDKFIL